MNSITIFQDHLIASKKIIDKLLQLNNEKLKSILKNTKKMSMAYINLAYFDVQKHKNKICLNILKENYIIYK